MDSSQYKDYVLTLLFVRYVSDKHAGQDDSLIEVPAGSSFKDIIHLKNSPNIGQRMNEIISQLAEANQLSGIIDIADFNDENKLGRGNDMVVRLTRLIGIFENKALDFSSNRADGDDLIGDAYEYLMRLFAVESGKSKGQFLTPSEVSVLMAKLVGVSSFESREKTIYDPTCGSGSLLLKAAAEVPNGISIYGQEIDSTTAALAKMNMILHNQTTAEIFHDDTLIRPHFTRANGGLKEFDYVVANPPFSLKNWSNGLNPEQDDYRRFEDGVPPSGNGDFAFLQHIIRSLKNTGRAAVIMPHGMLFRINAEATIRRNLIRKGLIKAIIGLPVNLFYGTEISTCIVVIDKKDAPSRRGIFFIDASKDFCVSDSKNRLRARDIHKIFDVFNKTKEIPGYSRMADMAEIEANDFSLNIPLYMGAKNNETTHDIEAHMLGGIPNRDIDALQQVWETIPFLRSALFKPSNRTGYSDLRVGTDAITQTISEHPEFFEFTSGVNALFASWMAESVPKMKAINEKTSLKRLIKDLAETLLQALSRTPLLDSYGVYQNFMDYCDEVMADDIDMLIRYGWVSILEDKPNEDLIPKDLIGNRFFGREVTALADLKKDREDFSSQIESILESEDEDTPLGELQKESGKVTPKQVKSLIKKLGGDAARAYNRDDVEILRELLGLIEAEAEASRKFSETRKRLEKSVDDKYGNLEERDVITLVVRDKWLVRINEIVRSEMNQVSTSVTNSVEELARRYADNWKSLACKTDDLEIKVVKHLERMGFKWD